MGFIIGTIATAITFAIVAYLLPQIDYGDSIPNLIILALIAGVVNGLIKPAVKALSLPLTMMTFGLFGLVVNALLLLLIAVIANGVGIDFSVGGFPPDFGLGAIIAAIIGAIALSIVGAIAQIVVPD
ncbi:MAG: phage holin family protein [Chloroflexi bacterium]|nr:phage holin family protein [Chloroflexota bacterium]